METKHRVSTKVLSLFLSVLMAASVFSIALPGLAPKASAAAGVYDKLGEAFQVAFDAGHMSTSEWTGVDKSTPGQVVVTDVTEKGFVYDIVRALNDVVVAESTSGGSYNHNTKLAAHIIEQLSLNEYQAKFINDCLPADGDYAGFDGVNGTWNGSESDLELDANKKTMKLAVQRSVGTAVVADYDDPASVPASVETSLTLSINASLKAVPSTNGSQTGGVYVNASAAVAVEKTPLETAEKQQLTALANYLAYVNADPFAEHYTRWFKDGQKDTDFLYLLSAEQLQADYTGFNSVYPAAAAAEQGWIEAFVGQELMNNQYEFFTLCGDVESVAEWKPYVDWIMPETSVPIPGYNARDNYSRTDRESLETALETGAALKAIMDGCPAATRALLVSKYGYDVNAYADYVLMLTKYIAIFDLQDMKIAHDWLLSHGADETYSFTNEESMFYVASAHQEAGYALSEDTEVNLAKTYYVNGTVYTEVSDPTADDIASYYTRNAATYTAATVFNSRETYYTKNADNEYEEVSNPVAADVASYYTRDAYTYSSAAGTEFDETAVYFTGAAGYVPVRYPAGNPHASNYYEFVPESWAGLKGIGNNEYIASAYGVFVLTEDEYVKEGKTYYTDATGQTEVANPVDANVASYYEASDDLCPISKEDLRIIYEFYQKAVTLINNTDPAVLEDVLSTEEKAEILAVYQSVANEYNSRSIASSAFLSNYSWFVSQMAGGAVEGMSVDAIIAAISTAESKYTALNNAYNGFRTADQNTGGTYGKAVSKCRDYVDKMYFELYKRAYSFMYVARTDYGSGINFNNYYAVKGDLLNANSTLLNWVNGHTGDITNAYNRLKANGNDVTFYVNTLKPGTSGAAEKVAVTALNVSYAQSTTSTSLSAMQSGVDGYTVSVSLNGISQFSKGSFTRYGGDYADFARKRDDKNFTVSTANGGNLQKTVNAIDKFLSNGHFTELLGEDEKGVNNLTEYIKQILVDNVFADSMVNTIVALVFPALCKLFNETLPTMLGQFQGKSLSDFSGDAGGRMYLYFDGNTSAPGTSHTGRSTDNFVSITEWMGLNIFPYSFGNYIRDHATNIAQRNAIGEWINDYWRSWDNMDQDDSGSFEAKDLALKFKAAGWSWGIDTIKRTNYASTVAGFNSYCDARYNKTKAVLSDIFGSAETILRTLFTTAELSKHLDGSSAGQNLAYGYVVDPSFTMGDGWSSITLSANGIGLNEVEADLKIPGQDLYHTVWIPVMEALGVNGDVTGKYTFPTVRTDGNFRSDIINGLLDPLYKLINSVAAKPVESVLKLLPNLSFHLMNKSLNKLLQRSFNLHLAITGADLCDGSGAVAGILQWGWVTDLLIGALKNVLSFDIAIDLGTMLDLETMLPFDISDLNALIQGVIGMIVGEPAEGETAPTLHLPAINMAQLAGAYSNKYTNGGDYGTQGRRKSGQDGNNTVFGDTTSRNYISAASSYQQVLYLLIRWVLDAASTPGFVGEVLGFIAALSGDDPIELPAIIFEILNKIKSTDDAVAALVEIFNYQDYKMFDIDWYNKTAAAGAGTLGLSLSDFVYLKYQNDWTEEKATYLYNNVDGIVNDVFNIIDPDLLAPYDGDANVWLDKFINSMFNNQGIWNVVDLMVKLGMGLAGNPNITKLIKQQIVDTSGNNLSTDLLAWFNAFGYRYADEPEMKEITTLLTRDQLGADDYWTGEYLKLVDGQYYVYANEKVEDKVASTTGNTVYVPYNANDATTFTATKLRAYPNSIANASYKAGTAASGFPNVVSLDEYTIDDEGNNVYTWQVKLNATTAGYVPGYSSGQTVKFVDGADNARAVFTALFTELAAPLANLFSFLLSGKNLKLFDAFELNGYEAYNGAVVPLLEAIGVTKLPTQAQYNAMTPTNAFNTIVNLLFEALDDLLTDDRTYDAQGNVTGGKGAFQKVIDVLPHLFYFLQSDGLSLVIKNLLMFVWTLVDTIRPLADINLDQAIHAVLCRLLKLTYDKSAPAYKVDGLINNVLDLVGINEVPYTSVKAAKDKKTVDAIFGVSLNSLSLESIFDVVSALTGIDLTPLTYTFEGMCIANTRNGVTYGVKKMTSVTSSASHTQQFVTSVFYKPSTGTGSGGTQESYTLNYYGPDIITVTFSAILDLLRYKDNAKALDELIGLAKDRLPGGGALLGETSAEGFLQSLEIIFADNKHSVDIDRPNWDYLFEDDGTGVGKLVRDPVNGNTFTWIPIENNNDGNTADDGTQWAALINQAGADLSGYHTIYNLAYSTDWTEDVATNVVATLESILDYVAVLMGSDKTFNEWITDFLNEKAFNASVIGILVDYLAMVYDFLPENIRGLIDNLLDVDMTGWERNGIVVKYDASSVEASAALRNEENPVEWTITTYTQATAYDEDEIYYKANEVEEGAEQTYSKVTVADAEAFAEGTFYTKSTEKHSEDRYVVTSFGDYKYVTTWTYGVAEGAAEATYHATDDVETYRMVYELAEGAFDSGKTYYKAETNPATGVRTYTVVSLTASTYQKNTYYYRTGAWQKLNVDGTTGKQSVASSYTVNYDYKWFDENDPAYVHDRATFLDAIREIVHSADDLFGYIFMEDDYKIFYTAGDELAHGQTGDDTDAIAINGVGLYGLLVVPVLEALDVPLTKARYDQMKANPALATLASYYADAFEGKPADFAYAPSKYYNASEDSYDTAAWIDDMFVVFEDLTDAILANPLERILDILPGLIYFINAGGFTTSIRNTFGVLQDLLNTVNQVLSMTGNDTEIGMVIGEIDLNNTSLSGLLNIVTKLLFSGDDNADKPKFHINDDIMKVCKELYVGDLETFVSANGYRSFAMNYSEEEDKKDMVTILVALLVEILTDKGNFIDPDNNYQYSPYDNPGAIAAMIGDGEYTDVVSEVVEALTNPKDLVVDYKDIKWDYFDETLDLANKEVPSGADTSVTVPGFAFQYLNYSTQWKYDKAVTTVDGLEELILAVLGMVNEDYQDLTAIGDLINMDIIYNANMVQSLLDLLSGLLFGADAVIPKELLKLVGAVLGADLSQWDYTYRFAAELEEGATVTGTENGLEYFTGHEMTTVYVAAPAAFDAEETYYTFNEVYTRADIEAFAEGETYYTKTGTGEDAVYTAVAADAVFDETERYFTKAETYIAATVDEESYEEMRADLFVATSQQTETEIKTYLVPTGDGHAFASALALVLRPAGNVLAWLLFDDPYEFFVGNTDKTKDDILLTIPGANGYEKGLVLLLEALGFKGLGYATKYTSGNVDEETGLKGYDLFLYDLAQSVVNRIDEIIADPIGEIIGLIPELIYFINANGLGVVVNNLLAGPLALVAQVPSVVALIDENADLSAVNNVVNDLVAGVLNDALKDNLDKNGNGELEEEEKLTFSMDGVNLKWIMELVEGITGLEITDLLANSLDLFYIGKVNAYASKARTVAYRMTFDNKGFINGGNGDMADFLTILLSFAIDLVTYTDEANSIDNAAALAALINGDKTADDSGYVDPALIQAIVKFIREGFTVEYSDFDWFYFDENYALYETDPVTGKLVRKDNDPEYDRDTAITVPVGTFNYLTYQSDWTEDTAQYLVDHRNEIVAAVLQMAGMDGTVADIVKGLFDPATDLYTAETLNAILNLVKPLVSALPAALLNIVGVILDVDLSIYNDMDEYNETNFTEGDRNQFVNELTTLLSPLNIILDWLLFGKDIQYFDKKIENTDVVGPGTADEVQVLINLKGAEGYKYGLVPLLEALGVTLPTIQENDTTATILPVLINNVLARVEAILNNPVDEVLDLIPELLYFINANGLATAVHNLLAGVFGLVENVASTGALNSLLNIPEGEEVDINGVINNLLAELGITLDINKLDLIEILKVVRDLTKVEYVEYVAAVAPFDEAKTYYTKKVTPAEEEGEEDKIEYVKVDEPKAEDIANYYEVDEATRKVSKGVDLIDFCTEKRIDEFYFGKMEGYVSANTTVAFKMKYSAQQDMADLITLIVNLALEFVMDESNAEAIDCLINGINAEGKPNGTTVSAIVAILKGLKELDAVDPEAIDWDYFLEEGELSATGITMPVSNFVYLDYPGGTNLWTRDLATGLGAQLTDVVNEILALTAGEGEEPKTLDALLDELVDLDSILTADLLNNILDTIAPLLYGEDSILAEELLNVIGLVLGADLTQWNNTYRFETFDAAYTYTEDAESGLKYRTGDTGLVYAIDGASDFASGLAFLLKPAQKLLGWLLLGNDYRFFVEKANGNIKEGTDDERDDKELLVIPGFEGYDLSLVLLLEALGCTGLKPAAEYEGNEAALIKDIINALINRLDAILDDPINNVLDLIPELIYFVNAGGLNAVVMNLAGSLLTVVEYINNSGLLEEPLAINDETIDRTIIDKLITGILNDALKDTLDKDENGELSDDEKLGFALADVNLSWIIDLAEKITGLAIQDAVGHTYDLSKLVIGGVERNNESVCTAYTDTYKAVSSAETRGDVITILLSLVLDVLQYKDTENGVDNAAVIAGMLEDVADGKITATVIDSAIGILQGWEDKITYLDPDWFYNVTEPATYTTDITETTDIVLVDRTINYLTYGANWTDANVTNLWTEDTARYLVDHIDEVIADVMKILGQEESSVADILKGFFEPTRDLYTADNLNAIVDLVKQLPDMLGDALVNIFGLILDIHLDAYTEMHFEVDAINSKETFIAGLIDVLKPVYTILDWFLFGKDLAFLYDNDYYNGGTDGRDLIHITGGYGYDNAIVPLFEALGIEMPAADKMEDAKLYAVLTKVMTKVETILADPVDEVLALIPNLIYFLNANGFSVVVGNLLASIIGLVDTAAPIIVEFVGDKITLSEEDELYIELTDTLGNILPTKTIINNLINGLLQDNDIDVTVDYQAIDLLTLVQIVEAATGLKIVDVLTENKIDKFYIGGIEYFKSANDKPAFRMSYNTAEEAHDMLTIVLNLAVEVLLYKVDGEYVNIDALCELVEALNDNKAMIVAIIELLTNPTEYTYKELNWNYFDEEAVLGDEIAVPKSKFIYLAYKNDWSFDKATALDASLAQIVDDVIAMIAKDDDPTTLSDLINGLVDIDGLIAKPEYLNSILELVQNYLFGEDAVLGQSLLDLVGLILGAELTDWNGQYEFEAFDEAIHTQTETATGLKYRLDGGKMYYGVATLDDFINGLCKILEPTESILAFILMGKDYGFFTNNEDGTKVLLRINGADGYKNGLALILEALGVEGLEPTYESANAMLKGVLTGLVNRVKALLADPLGDNGVLALITELIYFINANGLSVAIHNLAGAAFNVLDALDELGLGATEEDPDKKLLDIDELINGLLTDALGVDLGFTMDGINIQWIIDVAEIILEKNVAPIKINDVIDNSLYSDYPLEKLAIGKAVKYDSVSDLASAYKMVFGDGAEHGGAARADMITILLSFVLDFLRNDANQAAIESIEVNGEPLLKAGTIADILAVLSEYSIEITPDVDWFYFDPSYDYSAGADLTMFTPSIQYLSYASDWTEYLADYLDTNLDTIVASVLEMAGQESVANIIKNVFDPAEQLYTAENLNKIALAVANLTKDLQDVILNVAGLLLDVDLGYYKTICTYDEAEGEFTACTKFADDEITGRETFVEGLKELLAPIYPVLDWLLFGDSYKFFNRISSTDGAVVEDLLVINGYEGYAKGLVPILEAILEPVGVKLPDCSDPAAETYNTENMIGDVLSAVLFGVEKILADPVENVLALIPNLLYFINANGLASAVNHLAGAALALVEKVNPVLKDLGVEIMGNDEINVNDLINGLLADNDIDVTIDIKNIRLIDIVEVVEALTGLELTEFIVENGIENFYLGQITYFESSNGEPAFKMVYSEDTAKDRSDLITVLVNYLLEAVMFGDNAKTIDIMISGENDEGEPNKATVGSILGMIRKLGTEAVPGDYHWNYFNEESDDVTPEPSYTVINTPVTPFNNHLKYTTDWTQNTANTLYDNIDDVITAVLTIIAKGDETKPTTVAQILSNSFNLFTADNLNKIADLTKKLYDNFDASLVELIGTVLGCDLSQWVGLHYTDEEIYDADTFTAGLYEIVEPLSRVLDWLLFGQSYGFFVEDKNSGSDGTPAKTLINVGGANGYIFGLAQILIALGVDLPDYEEGYTCSTDVGGKTFLKAVLDAVVDRVEEILADPVDEALALLPELLYFINANGVSTAAYNLAGGVLNAINVLFQEGIIELKVDDTVYTSIEEYLAASIGLDIRNLDLEGIIAFLEAKDITKGIKINEVFKGAYTVSDNGEATFTYDSESGSNILEKFYCGTVTTYTYGGFHGWKMVAAEDKQGDILTMLLSIVLDVLYYEGNEQAIADLINDLWTDVEFTKDNFVELKALLQYGVSFNSEFNPDWAYFVENYDSWKAMAAEDQLALVTELLGGLPGMKGRTQHYLEYDNNWNANVVDYLDANINDIVDMVINMVTKGEYLDLEKLIEGKLDIYSADIVNKIVDRIAGLLTKLDEMLTKELQDKLIVTAGSLLGLTPDVLERATRPATEAEVHDKATFVKALVDRFSGLDRVLNWLLFAEDYTFFTDLDDGAEAMLVIKGGEGYKYGLAPILAALGVETEISAEKCVIDDPENDALTQVLNNVADRIDQLLYGADGSKTLNEVLALLPELIYFINTGAISDAVQNLLQPADELLKIVNENLGDGAVLGKDSVADFFSFTFNGTEYRLYDTNPAVKNYNTLDFDFIFDLVKDKVNIDIANSTGTSADGAELGTVGEYIKTFYFGKLESYTSYGGVQGYKMNYSEDDTRMDMLTILVTLVLDVFTSGVNEAAIVDILGGDENAMNTYDVIYSFLTGDLLEVKYQKFDWLFEEYSDTGIIVSPMTEDGTIVNQSIYGPLYTRPMGEYMTKYLQLAINTYITLLGLKVNGKQVFTLEDILTEVVGTNVYKNEYLSSIYNALLNLLTGLKEDTLGEELYEDIAYVLKEATRDPDNEEDIGVDLNYWFDEYTGPDEIEEGNQQQFIAEICEMLRPAYPILKWLLAEDKIAFFNKATGADQYDTETVEPIDDNDYLVLNGAAGYKYGIIPILEALCNGDTTNIKSYSEYLADIEADPTGDALLADILTPILCKVDEILADPINGVLNLLPAVIYFVGSNGLDTCFKNLLGSVFTLLVNIEPLVANVEQLHDENGDISLYPLIGIDLKAVNLETLLRQLLDSLKDSTGFSLSDLGVDLVNELSMGVIEEYDSLINNIDKEGDEYFQDMYTMKYAEEGTDVEGNKCDTVDFVTIILRLVLTFISDPDNKDAVEAMLKDKVSGDGYTLLCSLLDNFSQMVRTPDGKDKMMYTVYYVFYSALVAGVATNNAFAEFNGNYSFLNNLFTTSDLAFMRAIGESLNSILTFKDDNGDSPLGPIVDPTGVVPQGQIPFWQKIIEFFKQIINFFKNLFNS